MKTWYSNNQGNHKYAKKFRITPFSLLGIAIFYTIIIYRLIGSLLIGLFSAG